MCGTSERLPGKKGGWALHMVVIIKDVLVPYNDIMVHDDERTEITSWLIGIIC